MRVDFYLLSQSEPQQVLQFTSRLLTKAYDAGLRVFVLTESAEQAQMLDTLLWTVSDTSFIPHALAASSSANNALTKISIGSTLAQSTDFDMLVSLNNDEQITDKGYARIAELVSADEQNKQAARKRYAAWRDIGAELNLHNINSH